MMGENHCRSFQDADADRSGSMPMQVVLDGKRRVEDFLAFEIGPSPFRNSYKQEFQVDEFIAEILNWQKQLGNESVDNTKRDELEMLFIAKLCNDEKVGVQTEMEVRVIRDALRAEKGRGRNFVKNSETVDRNRDSETADRNRDSETADRIRDSETADRNRAEVETRNLLECLDYFSELHRTTEKTVLTLSIILGGHRILMRDLLPNAGEMSKHKRLTTCPVMNKMVHYPGPEFVNGIIHTLLDYANQITSYLEEEMKQQGLTGELVLLRMKFQAWFFVSFISLHPFSDGNGRMSRLILAYLQFSLSPIPVGLYSISSEADKHDYIKALVEVRLQHEEHRCCHENWCYHSQPSALAGMMLECLWLTWREITGGSNRELEPMLFVSK